jgi:hypothetical protein
MGGRDRAGQPIGCGGDRAWSGGRRMGAGRSGQQAGTGNRREQRNMASGECESSVFHCCFLEGEPVA